MYFIYVLLCRGDSLYTGITTNLTRRMRQHCGKQKGGAKYTRSHPPTALLCVWQTAQHKTAAQFEIYFKQLSRADKLSLIHAPTQWHAFFPKLSVDACTPIEGQSLEAYLSDNHDLF